MNDPATAKLWEGFSVRKEQVRFSEAVGSALNSGKILISEAGTGTGKTVGYLLPLLRYGLENDARVCVSTDTRQLQSQILGSDLPVVEKLLNRKIRAEICYGANNYICKRKLSRMMAEGSIPPDMLDNESVLDDFHSWHKQTQTGARPDYDGFATNEFWRRVGRDPDDCLGRKCPNFDISFYFLAKERWRNAELLIVNHSLLARHLLADKQLLPGFDTIVIDEAHKFPDAVADALIGRISTEAIADLPSGLENPEIILTDLSKSVSDMLLESAADMPGRQRITGPVGGLNPLIDACRKEKTKLEQSLEEAEELFSSEEAGDSERELKLKQAIRKMDSAASLLEALSTGPDDHRVHWAEQKAGQKDRTIVTYSVSPIETGPFIQEHLLEPMHSVVFSSATLSAGRAGFAPFAGRIGAQEYESCRIGSPFNYEKNAFVYVPESMPDIKNEDDFHRKAAMEIDRLVSVTNGGAFILFTSRRSLKDVHEKLETGLPLYSQEELGSPNALSKFRSSPDGVLLGLTTFWQGVDIPGDQLRLVVLVRLPFQVPDDPVLQARQEKVEKQGGKPFFELQLPDAVLKLKQGFGRLIRTRSDYGMISILDPRVFTKSYGKQFLGALPRMRVIRSPDKAEELWQTISTRKK